MSKERLEEIKSRVWKDKGTYVMGEENQREGYIYTLSDYDFEWLIQQAKRVQELEEELQELKKKLLTLTKENNQVNDELIDVFRENKRYREALSIISANLPLDGREHYVDIARQALEGEE